MDRTLALSQAVALPPLIPLDSPERTRRVSLPPAQVQIAFDPEEEPDRWETTQHIQLLGRERHARLAAAAVLLSIACPELVVATLDHLDAFLLARPVMNVASLRVETMACLEIAYRTIRVRGYWRTRRNHFRRQYVRETIDAIHDYHEELLISPISRNIHSEVQHVLSAWTPPMNVFDWSRSLLDQEMGYQRISHVQRRIIEEAVEGQLLREAICPRRQRVRRRRRRHQRPRYRRRQWAPSRIALFHLCRELRQLPTIDNRARNQIVSVWSLAVRTG